MTRYVKNINGIEIPMTEAEIAARQAEEQKWLEEKSKNEEEVAQKETEKASGKQKLKDLGLTDAEIKALTGA